MGIIRRIPNPSAGVNGWVGTETYHHRIVTTTSGTIDTATSDTVAQTGVTATKTGSETGRYTLQLPVPYKRVHQVIATIKGADDAAYGAITLGLPYFVRDDDIATDGTIEVQFVAGDTNWSDAEIADGAAVMFTVIVSRGT